MVLLLLLCIIVIIIIIMYACMYVSVRACVCACVGAHVLVHVRVIHLKAAGRPRGHKHNLHPAPCHGVNSTSKGLFCFLIVERLQGVAGAGLRVQGLGVEGLGFSVDLACVYRPTVEQPCTPCPSFSLSSGEVHTSLSLVVLHVLINHPPPDSFGKGNLGVQVGQVVWGVGKMKMGMLSPLLRRWHASFRTASPDLMHAHHTTLGAPTGLDRLVRHSCAKSCVATAVTAFFASSCAELPGVLKGPCDAGAGPVVGLKNDARGCCVFLPPPPLMVGLPATVSTQQSIFSMSARTRILRCISLCTQATVLTTLQLRIQRYRPTPSQLRPRIGTAELQCSAHLCCPGLSCPDRPLQQSVHLIRMRTDGISRTSNVHAASP
jgi:hypothetical protein